MVLLATKRFKCPHCGVPIVVDITDDIIEAAAKSPSGVTAVIVPHAGKRAIVYVDTEGNVRGVTCTETEEKTVVEELREIPVPSQNPPDPRKLSRKEWKFLALSDGRRSINEIANLLGISYQEARLLAEKLRSRGYIEDVILEI